MAKVKITGHASGTGILTVTAPNTSTDRTITLPDSTGTLATTADAFDPDGAVTINDTGADVDFRVESDTRTHALFVDGAVGTVAIGITPEVWHSIQTSMQIGGYGALNFDSGTGAGGGLRLLNNAYLDAAGGWKHIITDEATGYLQYDGEHHFRTAVSAAADASVTWSSPLIVKADGRGLSQFTAKAWVNFNGSGTLAVNDSHNVSSVTDHETGNYSVNFSNNMANANFSSTITSGNWETTNTDSYTCSSLYDTASGQSVSKQKFRTIRLSNHEFKDPKTVCATFFGD